MRLRRKKDVKHFDWLGKVSEHISDKRNKEQIQFDKCFLKPISFKNIERN